MTAKEFADNPAIADTWGKAGPVVCQFLAEMILEESRNFTSTDAGKAVAHCSRIRALSQLHRNFSHVGMPDPTSERPKMQALVPE